MPKRLIKSLAAIENKGILRKGDQIRNSKSLFADCKIFYLNFLQHVKINMAFLKICIPYSGSTRQCSSQSTSTVATNICKTLCIFPTPCCIWGSRGSSS